MRNRQLAAIMFTDIIGYTALMQQNEAKAVEVRTRHRIVFEEQHSLNQGEVVQYFGDGTLSIFQSAIEAVECAIAIQKKLTTQNPIPLRIGIHLGDIIYDGTDIYGNAVNVASRIESMGTAEAILISGQLNKELQNHPHIQTVSMGYFELKNIKQTVEIFAISNEGIKVPPLKALKGKGKKETTSIAVLPFINMSASKDNEYFSDGITEEIINALAKIKNLKVTSRTSSFYFKNKNIPITQIGKELNVSSILEGSVRLGGNKVRITAQLINVEEDFHFWSETFDRSLDDIFAVQDEISLLIADKLRENMGHFDIDDQLVETPEIPVPIYKKYLKGRYLIHKLNLSDIQKGIAVLQEIIESSPNFPLPYTAIHFGYTFLAVLGIIPAHEAFAKGNHYIIKALELDSQLPECQHYLAGVNFWQRWDLDATYKHLNKAIKIKPGYADAYQAMSLLLVIDGNFAAGKNYIDTALQLNPFSAMNHYLLGILYYMKEQYESAIPSFEKAISIEPNFMMSYVMQSASLLLLGKIEAGMSIYQNLPEVRIGKLIKLGGETLVYAVAGNEEKAEEGIALLKAELQSEFRERTLIFLLVCYSALGKYEAAIDLFEQGVKERLPVMVMMPPDPIVKTLRPIPRYQKIVQEIYKKRQIALQPKKKYKKSSLKQKDVNAYLHRLEKFMETEKPYLQPDLSLRQLAEITDIHPNHLSQLLNEQMDKRFSEYINSYRLETFKSLAGNPANRHLTILAIAYESGFNSKTVFNTFFKKMMGMTPSQYWKAMRQN